MHRKDLIKLGYRTWPKKGTKSAMQAVGKMLKGQKKIISYVVSKCPTMPDYELYVKR